MNVNIIDSKEVRRLVGDLAWESFEFDKEISREVKWIPAVDLVVPENAPMTMARINYCKQYETGMYPNAKQDYLDIANISTPDYIEPMSDRKQGPDGILKI
jgi:hypothetical protein